MLPVRVEDKSKSSESSKGGDLRPASEIIQPLFYVSITQLKVWIFSIVFQFILKNISMGFAV